MSTFNTNFPVKGFPLDNFQPFNQNWTALDEGFEVDHTKFSDPSVTTRGHHRQVFYNAPLLAPAPVPTGSQAAAFPRTSAAPGPLGVTQEIFQNVRGGNPCFYILSCIKAWGFGGFGAGVSEGFNVSGITNPSAGKYSVTFTTALPSANYGVLITSHMTPAFNNGSIIGFDALATTGFDIYARSLTGNSGVSAQFTFMVLQT